ncbi:MAG: hypothetical protein ACREXT_07265 [Gammaproteobacteria bacterium]
MSNWEIHPSARLIQDGSSASFRGATIARVEISRLGLRTIVSEGVGISDELGGAKVIRRLVVCLVLLYTSAAHGAEWNLFQEGDGALAVWSVGEGESGRSDKSNIGIHLHNCRDQPAITGLEIHTVKTPFPSSSLRGIQFNLAHGSVCASSPVVHFETTDGTNCYLHCEEGEQTVAHAGWTQVRFAVPDGAAFSRFADCPGGVSGTILATYVQWGEAGDLVMDTIRILVRNKTTGVLAVIDGPEHHR